MWPCAFVSLILIISVWLCTYGIIKNNHSVHNTAIEVDIIQKEKSQILNDSTANVFVKGKVKQHVPKFMLDLYENSKSVKKNELNKSTPDIVRSVVPMHEETIYPNLFDEEHHDNHMLIFNIPNTNIDELFISAELRILTLIEIQSTFALGIERQIQISLYNETTQELQKLEEKHIYHTDNTWISFNISNTLQLLLSEPQTKVLKLVVTVKTYLPFVESNIGVFKLSLMPVTENFEHDYPVLLLFYVSTKSEPTHQSSPKLIDNRNESIKTVRKRRHLDEDYEEETNKLWDEDIVNKAVAKKIKRLRNSCKRKPLYINFAEIDYDTWIVQPVGYEAYQCTGKCFYPVSEYLSPTKHAIVQALLHSVAPARAPRSCCVPTKLESISVLYVDASGVLTYRYGYKDMVVSECGCR